MALVQLHHQLHVLNVTPFEEVESFCNLLLRNHK